MKKRITTDAAAAILSRNINTVIRYCKSGKLKAEFVTDPPRHRWLIELESVYQLLADEIAAFEMKMLAAEKPPIKVRPSRGIQNSIIRTSYPKQVKEDNDRLHREGLAAFRASGKRPRRLERGDRVG